MAIVDFVRISEVKHYSPNTATTYSSLLLQAELYFRKQLLMSDDACQIYLLRS